MVQKTVWYKFDPMDFETLVGCHLYIRLLYKFDPMDFETIRDIVFLERKLKV